MKQWKVLDQRSEASGQRSVEEIIDVLLKNRGIELRDIQEFLNPSLESVTLQSVGIDVQEVKKTLDLIQKTIADEKAIVIYGDYDVDGICGTAIVWETIYSFYKNVHPYIPHRIDEGYGLSIQGIENSKQKIENIGLIITVDNGIVANKAVDYAQSLGIKVVITDHHTKGKINPNAAAIVHTTELCGTGVAYLLAQEIFNLQFSIFNKLENKKVSNEEKHLELVALATVADLVPLNKHNRTLLKFGLDSLRKTKRPGLLALFEEAKIDKKTIDTYQIGHMIAPRLNASGRITHALDSLRLVCTNDPKKAKTLAMHLNTVNRERQQMTMDSAEHAKQKILGQELGIKNLLFVEDEEYDQGIIGLIASKLVEEFYRPSIAVSVGDKISKGSARSISGVNIIELIRSVPDLLSEAGGHPMAAGFSIETSKLPAFKEVLIQKAEEIEDKLFDRVLKIDLELPWNAINMELYEALQTLSPFGMGNPQPTFMTRGVAVASIQRVGKEGKHLQMLFEKDGDFIKGMKFGDGSSNIRIGDIIDVVYTMELNEWNNQRKIEIRVKDIR